MPPAEKPTPEPTYAPQTKLAVVYFRESVTFGTEMQSASVPVRLKSGDLQRGSNTVDSIEIGYLGKDGSIAADNPSPSDGLVLRSKVHDLHSGKRIVRQVFVPWSNVKSIGYSE
jgi:hypothetical protein